MHTTREPPSRVAPVSPDGGIEAQRGEPGNDPNQRSVVVAGQSDSWAILRAARRIAVVGASPDPSRPSHEVMRYLLAAGYDCVPINPSVASVLGRKAFPDLTSAAAAIGRFDIVDVFRRPDAAPEIARQAAAIGAGALWLQLEVISWDAARIAAAAGLAVVMDRCTKIEHRAMRAAQDAASGGDGPVG